MYSLYKWSIIFVNKYSINSHVIARNSDNIKTVQNLSYYDIIFVLRIDKNSILWRYTLKKIIIFTLFFSLLILSCDKIPSTKEASKRTLLPSLFPRDNINTLSPAFYGEWYNILSSDVTMYVSAQDGRINHYGIYNGYIYVKDLSADHAGKPTALFEKANSFAAFQANSFILYVLAKGYSIEEQVRTAVLSFPHRKIVGIK